MAIVNSLQGLPYPDNAEAVKDVPDFIRELVFALDRKIVGVYATQAALTTAGGFVAGQLVWITADNVLQIYNGSAWLRVYPATPSIFSGVGIPASTLGQPGDVYVRY